MGNHRPSCHHTSLRKRPRCANRSRLSLVSEGVFRDVDAAVAALDGSAGPIGPVAGRFRLETEFTRHEFEGYFERWRPTFAGAGFHVRVNSRVARSYVAKSLTALATTNAPVIVASNCEASSDERPSCTSFS